MKKILFFDVEWANPKNKSICQMGLMIEDFETGDPIFPELNVYVNPEDSFDINCVNVHKINFERIRNEKTFDKIWPEIKDYFINSIVVGHNVRSSDLNALCRNLSRYNIEIPQMYYLDTYELAREYISLYECKSHGLGDLCEYFKIPIDNEHDAFDDACACSDLLRALVKTYKIDVDDYINRYIPDEIKEFNYYIDASIAARELNTLIGIINGIIMDRSINELEKDFLVEWKREHIYYQGDKRLGVFIDIIDEILEDNKVTLEELGYLKNELNKFILGIKSDPTTRATQYLRGILIGLVADDKINELEIFQLREWLYNNESLRGHYPYDKIFEEIEKVLEDGFISTQEKDALVFKVNKILDPVKYIEEKIVDFNGKSVCVTGQFLFGSRKEVHNYLVEKGAIIKTGVSGRTDYLIVGSLGSEAYANKAYGGKIEKALNKGCVLLREDQVFK